MATTMVNSGDEKVMISTQDNLHDLSTFVLKRVIRFNSKFKSICLEGMFTDRDGVALLLLERRNISYGLVEKLVSKSCVLKKIPDCDSYECIPEAELSGLKMTLIFPATERHIKKFEPLPFHLIHETSELYREVTLPCITKGSFNLQWVYNIFDHKAEQDTIIYEDTDPVNGFLFLPDLKWSQKTMDNLYCLAIARPRGITSLRDITSAHLPLLRNIRSKGLEVIREKFGLSRSQLRVYIHYQPSYYHLHVHFTNIEFKAPGIFVTKSHLLDKVISNLEAIPDYYQRSSLSFMVKETDNLFLSFKEKGLVKELPPRPIVEDEPNTDSAVRLESDV